MNLKNRHFFLVGGLFTLSVVGLAEVGLTPNSGTKGFRLAAVTASLCFMMFYLIELHAEQTRKRFKEIEKVINNE